MYNQNKSLIDSPVYNSINFQRMFFFSFFSAFVDVLVCGLMCVMVLIAALFVSLGFRVWCDEMTRRFETCSDAMGNPIDKVNLLKTFLGSRHISGFQEQCCNKKILR
jgi:hypothetical protein